MAYGTCGREIYFVDHFLPRRSKRSENPRDIISPFPEHALRGVGSLTFPVVDAHSGVFVCFITCWKSRRQVVSQSANVCPVCFITCCKPRRQDVSQSANVCPVCFITCWKSCRQDVKSVSQMCVQMCGVLPYLACSSYGEIEKTRLTSFMRFGLGLRIRNPYAASPMMCRA